MVEVSSDSNSRKRVVLLQNKFDEVNIFNISNKANYAVMGSTG